MQGQESKDLRGIEYFVHRDQIVIGVLEANVPCAVVDRLNPAKVEKAGVIGRSRKAVGWHLSQHRANSMLQRLHDFRVLADFTGIHKIPRLNLNFEWLYFPDGVAQLLDGLSRIVSREKPPIEHDSTLALDRVSPWESCRWRWVSN